MIYRTTPFFPFVFTILALGYSSTETAVAQDEHLLWKIEGEQNTVYLLGSIHVLPESAYPLPGVFEEAYGDAEVVAMEAVIDEQAMVEMQMMLATQGRLEDGKTLEDVLSPELYEATKVKMGETGLPFAMFATLKPWLVAITLVQTEISSEGYEASKGVDLHYMERAKKDGKTVLGLESLGSQFAIFNELSDEAQALFLEQTLDDLKPEEDDLKPLVTAWQNADLAAMDSIMQEGLGSDDEMYDKLLVRRNRNWIPHLEGYLKSEKDHLVVVGALHLVGKDGVVTMLEELGYRVEQL